MLTHKETHPARMMDKRHNEMRATSQKHNMLNSAL